MASLTSTLVDWKLKTVLTAPGGAGARSQSPSRDPASAQTGSHALGDDGVEMEVEEVVEVEVE